VGRIDHYVASDSARSAGCATVATHLVAGTSREASGTKRSVGETTALSTSGCTGDNLEDRENQQGTRCPGKYYSNFWALRFSTTGKVCGVLL
jgi:hypothetical protein